MNRPIFLDHISDAKLLKFYREHIQDLRQHWTFLNQCLKYQNFQTIVTQFVGAPHLQDRQKILIMSNIDLNICRYITSLPQTYHEAEMFESLEYSSEYCCYTGIRYLMHINIWRYFNTKIARSPYENKESRLQLRKRDSLKN
jgi:hypothetical protein